MFYAINKKASFIGLGLFLALGFLGNSTAQADWKAEWEKTVEAAKKEGHLTTYISGYERVLEPFKKKYPEIKVVSITGSSTQIAQRILTERRAEKYLADIFSGGANTQYGLFYKGKVLDPIKSLFILPEVVDKSKWLEKRHAYADPEGKYIFAYRVSPGLSLMYNLNLLKPKEFNSYWDLLNPKWKGKIVSLEPKNTRAGSWMIFLYHQPELGAKFIRQLYVDMDVTFSSSTRQMTDWLSKGKFAICIRCSAREAQSQGLPVRKLDGSVWKEGGQTSPGLGALSFINRAPHPNAAKVFVNWFLSREGQMAFQRTGGRPGENPNSRRIDIPKDIVPPWDRIVEGRKYMDTNRPEYQENLTKVILKLGKQVMEDARKTKRK